VQPVDLKKRLERANILDLGRRGVHRSGRNTAVTDGMSVEV
jgi:hypothetical protein